MEREWHEVLLHDEKGDAAFVQGAPRLAEALHTIRDVHIFSTCLNVGLHIKGAHANPSTATPVTFTERQIYEQRTRFSSLTQPYLDGFVALFRSTIAAAKASSATPAASMTISEATDGLLFPKPPAIGAGAALELSDALREHSMFNYAAFRQRFDAMSRLVSSGEAFSACEPRLRIVRSRFQLYRAFNGKREDEYHHVFGGGDIKRAPKCDLRRVETCMSAASVVRFLTELRRQNPTYPLFTEEGMTNLEGRPDSSGVPAAAAVISVDEALRYFFGPDVPLSKQVVTEEGLCLRPSYAGDGTERWLSLKALADSGPNMRAVHASRLLQALLSPTGGADGNGSALAQLILPLLTQVLCSGSSLDRLELELTVTGRVPGELERLAEWYMRSGLCEHCPSVFFRVHIVPDAYSAASNDSISNSATTPQSANAASVPNFVTVLQNIFDPIWEALLRSCSAVSPLPSATPMQLLVSRLVGFSVSLAASAAVQEMPHFSDPSVQFPLDGPAPPDVYAVYHYWRSVQLLNGFLYAVAVQDAEAVPAPTWPRHSGFTFLLHGSTNSRTLFSESVLGLLLADTVVNPTAAFQWSPLTYLYYLTQRHIVLTPSRNRCSEQTIRQTLKEKAIPLAVAVGLHVSMATIDPLFYDTTNDALSEELVELTKQLGLANADVTEMCLRSLEAGSGMYAPSQWAEVFGYAWPRAEARFNQFATTQVNSLRLHQRTRALSHEISLVLSAAAAAKANTAAGAVASSIASDSAMESLYYLLQVSPPSHDERTGGHHGYALPWEGNLHPLQNLPGYHAHEPTMRYPRIVISGPQSTAPSSAAKRLVRAMDLRSMYQELSMRDLSSSELRGGYTPDGTESLVLRDGVFDFVKTTATPDGPLSSSTAFSTIPPSPLPTWREFQRDTRELRALSSDDPAIAKYAAKRLDMLEWKYKLHVAVTNDDEEPFEVVDAAAALVNDETDTFCGHNDVPVGRSVAHHGGGDAHNCFKVDVHCHMAGGVTANALLTFMKNKVASNPNDVVDVDAKTGQPITLLRFFAKVLGPRYLGSVAADKSLMAAVAKEAKGGKVTDAEWRAVAPVVQQLILSMPIAALQVRAGNTTFQRFDRFNNRFSPMGMTSLRSLFLKTDNYMQGRYFAELIRGVHLANDADGRTFTEFRLSIYGRDPMEWDRLARWFVLHGMSHRTNQWMVQIPRLFHLYRRAGVLSSFQDMLSNCFEPLWQASMHPEKHPFIHHFLSHVTGFDSVDNESDRESDQLIHLLPKDWTEPVNPSFAYYMYYMWANITALNRYRAARGFTTFSFRPHAGESGDPDHMADAFLLADGIGHGINLDQRPALQYLYYLAQIPLAIVPMSNNALFCRYADHPFPRFFYRGLNVALGTDGALIFHRTDQPLLEEYGTAEALWGLSTADICELAANSVRMSDFTAEQKKEWLGPLCAFRSVAGNDPTQSHVPHTRCAFRYETYMEEVTYLQNRAGLEMGCRAMRTPLEEDLEIMESVGVTRQKLLEMRWANEPIAEKMNAPTVKKAAGLPIVTAERSHI